MTKPSKSGAATSREDRLKQALRANLQRRKSKARETRAQDLKNEQDSSASDGSPDAGAD